MTTIRAKILKEPGKQRYGRGFSREELKKAGTNPREAIDHGVPIDRRRRTAHEENVEVIKAFLEDKKKTSKTKGKT